MLAGDFLSVGIVYEKRSNDNCKSPVFPGTSFAHKPEETPQGQIL